jgi:hypothetical protein
MSLSAEQRRAVVSIVESTAWATVAGSVATLDAALKLALELTREDFALWHEHLESAGYENEFDEVMIRDLPDELKSALVARLLRTIAMAYGVGTEFGSKPLGAPCLDQTLAVAPVRRLLEIV